MVTEHGMGFCDLAIWSADRDLIYLASITGPQKTVWSLAHAINRGERVHATPIEGMHWDRSIGRWGTYLRGEKRKYVIDGDRGRQNRGEETDCGRHLVVIRKDAIGPNAKPFLLLNVDANMLPISEADAFWREWQRRFAGAVPGLPEWAPYVWEQLKWSSANVERLKVYQEEGRGISAYLVTVERDDLRNIITRGLRLGRLTIPDGYPIDEGITLDGVETTADYLTRMAAPLSRRVHEMYTPRFQPGVTPRNPLLDTIGDSRKYKLLPSQEGVVQGLVDALKEKGSVVLAGEMGVGKTAMGIAIAKLARDGKPSRWIVMCPPHLVTTWQMEIRRWMRDASVFVVESVSDLEKLVNTRPWKPATMEFVILSRERAKLGSVLYPAVVYGYRPSMDAMADGRHLWKSDLHWGPICPRCGRMQVDREGAPLPWDFYKTRRLDNQRCQHCDEPLWAVGYPAGMKGKPITGKALRRPEGWSDDIRVVERYPLATYIKRRLKGWAVGLIADEVHEMKNDTAQSSAFGTLSAACRYLVAMTGTLTGGYAHDLFRLLFRLNPKVMKANGFTYDTGGMTRFAQTYGQVEWVTKTFSAEMCATAKGGRKSSTTIRALPAVSPRIFGELVMDRTGFLRVEDLGMALPELSELVELVTPSEELLAACETVESDLRSLLSWGISKGDKRGVGLLVTTYRFWLDRPWGFEPILSRDTRSVIAKFPDLPESVCRRKVDRLAEIAHREKRLGRRCLVLADATDTRDIQPWLKQVLEASGLKVAVMYGRSVPPKKRLAWVHDRVREGVDVLICNPNLIATGLTLLDFPTVIWYQVGYNTFLLRQASRRSWRIGQTKPVKVVYLAYKDTIQERALQLMGAKLEAALGLEGKLTDEGLRMLATSDDIVMALAKSLVKGIDATESAEEIWKRIASKEIEAGSYRAMAEADLLAELPEEEDLPLAVATSAEEAAAAEAEEERVLVAPAAPPETAPASAEPAPTYVAVDLAAFLRGKRKSAAKSEGVKQLVFFGL